MELCVNNGLLFFKKNGVNYSHYSDNWLNNYNNRKGIFIFQKIVSQSPKNYPASIPTFLTRDCRLGTIMGDLT